MGWQVRTFELSAPKVRTDENERSGKCGIPVGMFLGRSTNTKTPDARRQTPDR